MQLGDSTKIRSSETDRLRYIQLNRELEALHKDEDITEDIIYGISSDQQVKINTLLKSLNIESRKRQNINFIKINVKVRYFPNPHFPKEK